MSEKSCRATIVRDNGAEEEWGFYELEIMDGLLLLRCSEETPVKQFDHFIAPGTWREVRDIMEEGNDCE